MIYDTDYNSVLTRLVFLTKRNNLSNAQIGKPIAVERQAMSGRAERNSKFKPDEIEKIEAAFDVDLSVVSIIENSGERQNDTKVDEKSSQFGKRVAELQAKHNFLDREMAQLLKISEKEYLKLALGKIPPTLDILNRLKQNFKVSIDQLLYGE